MIHDQAKRLTARVAPYLDAIKEAKNAGLTWDDIAKALQVKNPDSLRKAVYRCRYKADQVGLPGLQATQPSAPVRTQTPAVSGTRPKTPGEIRRLKESIDTDQYI